MDGASVQPPCRAKPCGLDPSVTRRTTAAAASVLVITAHPHRTIEANDQHARPLCKDEQHTRSDRHAASKGEEPAIQFGTDVLIGLQQGPGRRRHQHRGHHKDKPGECDDHPKDDHPYAVRVPCGFATGLSADPVLIRPLPYLKQARPKRSVSARADSLPSRARRRDTRCRESRSATRR